MYTAYCDSRDLFIIDTIDRDYKCMIYLGTVIKNRRGKESLALSKKWPKIHFEEKILENKHVYILVTKIYYWNIQRTWNGHQKVDIDRFTP